MTTGIEDRRRAFLPPLRARLRWLYHSRTPAAVRFQYAVITIDLAEGHDRPSVERLVDRFNACRRP